MYVVDEDSYLEHIGKKGMKWGLRREASINRGNMRINKVGGSAGKAYGVIAGKQVAQHVMANGLAVVALKTLGPKHPMVGLGIAAVAGYTEIGFMGKNVRDALDVRNAKNDKLVNG